MIPANFPFQNCVLKGGSDDVQDLPCYRHPEQCYFLSCWKLDAVELEQVGRTGVVWAYVFGGHPPIMLSGTSPFKEVVQGPVPTNSREVLQELATWHTRQAAALHELLANSQTLGENGRPKRFVDEDGFTRAQRIVAQGGLLAPWLESNNASPRHQLSGSSEGEGLRSAEGARAEVDPAEAGRDADPPSQDASRQG